MIIKFNKQIYDKKLIEETIKQFDKLLDITFLDEEYTLELKNKTENNLIEKEFCNYLLNLVIENEFCN